MMVYCKILGRSEMGLFQEWASEGRGSESRSILKHVINSVTCSAVKSVKLIT